MFSSARVSNRILIKCHPEQLTPCIVDKLNRNQKTEIVKNGMELNRRQQN